MDWKDCWKENNVDNWLLRKASGDHRLGALTTIGRYTEDLICQVSLDDALIPELANAVLQEQFSDEIDWDWVEHRQRELVRRHSTAYGGSHNN